MCENKESQTFSFFYYYSVIRKKPEYTKKKARDEKMQFSLVATRGRLCGIYSLDCSSLQCLGKKKTRNKNNTWKSY